MKANEVGIYDVTKYGRVVGVWEARAGKIKLLFANGTTKRVLENEDI